MTGPPPSRRALVALVVFAALGLLAAACSGGGDGDAGDTTTTTPPADGSMPIISSDPSQPVLVPVGRRFAIMVPADPEHGWRWVVEPVDTRLLAPLGSEFREDPALLASATTTTTAPPPPDTTAPELGETTTTADASTTTEPGPTTTTTAPGPLVQIISYAGRADGATTVTLRYERIGGDGGETPQTMVFTVLVGNVVPPPTIELPLFPPA